MLRHNRLTFAAPILLLLCVASLSQNNAGGRTPRAAVQQFFTLLKAQQYDKLYELLPSQMQQETTREQLSASLKRLDEFLIIEKLQLGRVQEHGEFAVVDTTIYGKLKKPLTINEQVLSAGRATAQQYLRKENGQWKIVTADERTRAVFLNQNPAFSQQFQLTRARFEFKQKGQWQSFNAPRNALPRP
ncbi:MAG: hypothetical protein HYR56_12365 [Acidobacteria bacterium]|nr:hypothetical protein [Acidobacteriota bacterium]MBI3423236.1 hypothetical protein [Acidobacteriota bacterium]